MALRAKLRAFGGAVLLFNLWLIGSLSISGWPVLLLTVGFAVGYEAFVVRLMTVQPPAPTSMVADEGGVRPPPDL